MTKLLSDEKIEDLYFGELDNRTLSFARAIEAAVLEAQAMQEPVMWNKPMTVEDSFRAAPVVQPDMVMPKKMTINPGARLADLGYAEGWNACIDAMIAAAEGKE